MISMNMNQSETKDFYCDFVLNNKISVEKLVETENVLAFYHTKPSWTFHAVIVPKKHVSNLVELGNMDLIKEIFELAREIIIEKGLDNTNYKIITNGGNFQDSKHLHFHLVSGSKLE